MKNSIIGIGKLQLRNEDKSMDLKFIIRKNSKEEYLVQACFFPILACNNRLHIAFTGFIGLLSDNKDRILNDDLDYTLTYRVSSAFLKLYEDFDKKSEDVIILSEDKETNQLINDWFNLTHQEIHIQTQLASFLKDCVIKTNNNFFEVWEKIADFNNVITFNDFKTKLLDLENEMLLIMKDDRLSNKLEELKAIFSEENSKIEDLKDNFNIYLKIKISHLIKEEKVTQQDIDEALEEIKHFNEKIN